MAKNSSSEGKGPSQRQLRVGEVIRRAMSEALMRGEIHDPDLNRMSITVGEVRTSPDLRIATAYVLPLGGKGQEEAIALLARNKGEMRRLIGNKTKLKYTPDLRFQIDRTFDQIDQTHRMLAEARVQKDLQQTSETEQSEQDTNDT